MVSIIVPVYNAEKIIRRTVTSIEKQSYGDIEVILINDGSKDQSLEVCKQLKMLYHNIVVVDQNNQGASAARNAGIRHASGDWLLFVDSDDTIPVNSIMEMTANISEEINIIVGGYLKDCLSSDGCDEMKPVDIKSTEFMKAALAPDLYSSCLQQYVSHSNMRVCVGAPWGKLIRKQFLIDNHICFPEGLVHHEDTIFCLEMYRSVSYVRFLDIPVYQYFDTENSVSARFHPDKIQNMIAVSQIAADLCGHYKELEVALAGFVVARTLDCFSGYVAHIDNRKGFRASYDEINPIKAVEVVQESIRAIDPRLYSNRKVSILLQFLKHNQWRLLVLLCIAMKKVKRIRSYCKKKRILIKAFCATNFGDDLCVRLLCEKFPDTIFYLQTPKNHCKAFEHIANLRLIYPKSVKSILYKINRTMFRRHRLYHFQKIDATVYIGDFIFIEMLGLEKDQSFRLSDKMTKSAPSFIIGANFGPYYTRKYIEDYKRVFLKVTDICFRDQQSYDLFSDLRNVRWAPDCLFQTQLCHMPRRAAEKRIIISVIKNNGRAGFLEYDETEYFNKISEIAGAYLEQGYGITFLDLCTAQEDYMAIYDCVEQLGDNRNVAVYHYDGNLEKVLEIMNSGEYVIASRFHAVIFSWLLRKPVLPIVYGDKTMNAIQSYQYEGVSFTIDEFIHASFEEIDKNRKDNYLFEISDLITQSEKQFAGLSQFLRGDCFGNFSRE